MYFYILLLGFFFYQFHQDTLQNFFRKYSHISYESSIDISENVERVIDNLYLIKILNKFTDEKELFQK